MWKHPCITHLHKKKEILICYYKGIYFNKEIKVKGWQISTLKPYKHYKQLVEFGYWIWSLYSLLNIEPLVRPVLCLWDHNSLHHCLTSSRQEAHTLCWFSSHLLAPVSLFTLPPLWTRTIEWCNDLVLFSERTGCTCHRVMGQ